MTTDAKTKRQREKERDRIENLAHGELEDLLAIIFTLAGADFTYEEIASRSTLCAQTVARYATGEWKWPRFSTIQKLAYAVNLQIVLGTEGVTLVQITDALEARETKRKSKRASKRRAKAA